MKMHEIYIWICLPALLLAAGSALARVRHVTECGAVLTKPGNYHLTCVSPDSEMIGYLSARRVHLWYSEVGLPTIQAHLRSLIGKIDYGLMQED